MKYYFSDLGLRNALLFPHQKILNKKSTHFSELMIVLRELSLLANLLSVIMIITVFYS